MNQDFKNLSQWLKANKLTLNVKKTELIVFHPQNTKLDYSVKFNDEASQFGKLKAEPNNCNS